MIELTTNLLAEIGGWPALKEARALVERGKVSGAKQEGAVIRARVQGAEKIYDPQITLADRVANVEVRCTCAESRRRVCPHILAAGLAILQRGKSAASDVSRRTPGGGPPMGTSAATWEGSHDGHRPPLQAEGVRRLLRWLVEEAPAGTPQVEVTVLLPLQLRESLGKDPVRVILEARRGNDLLPWDAVVGGLDKGFAVSEEDDRVLTALEQVSGGIAGINAVPRLKMGALLRALSGHPRIWLGKKQRVEVWGSSERTRIVLSMREDGALEMDFGGKGGRGSNGEAMELRGQVRSQIEFGNEGAVSRSAAATTEKRHDGHRPPLQGEPSHGVRRLPEALPIAGWSFDGERLTETPMLPAGFLGDKRLILQEKIPDFLSREFPALERSCELVFAPGFAEFQLEIAQPAIEARLEGLLSGLTLDLVARYGDKEFSLSPKTDPSAYQRYVPDARQANRFWRRNVIAEREALMQAEAAGFGLVRIGATTFSLSQENRVARFWANVLPRWKRNWSVSFGSRLEATLREVDIAEPEFSLKSGSGEDWLGLDLKLSVGGKPVPLDQAEIQRWLQTGQSHARMANKRTLLVPTEAWSEMQEVLADCAVEQEPGQIRVERKFAPFLSGALSAQGFRSLQNVAADWPKPEVKAVLEVDLWERLRPYQAQGVEWMAGLAQQNLHGLLADDMGLGKTLQALAFCAWVKGNNDLREMKFREEQERSQVKLGNEGTVARSATATTEGRHDGHRPPLQGEPPRGVRRLPALVVCPTSLVTNWLREAARFTPHLRTLDLTGADRAEKWAKRHEYDLLVTSYAILRRDIELYRADEFSLVILDEAQHIKNRGSQNALSAKALRAQHRLILTGTPLENSVLDLWSLYDFLLPGYLGTVAEFKERYETPLTKEVSPKVMERLRHRVKPFFLRRTKEEVLTELPPKLEYPTLCELTDEQREVYKAVLAQGRRDVFEHSGKQGQGRDRIAVLTTLLRLRQVCCHLDLLPAEPPRGTAAATSEGKADPSPGGRGLPQKERHDGHRPPRQAEGDRRWKEPSAKMERTFELIDEAIDGGHRVLLFSQFVKVLHLLREEATRRGINFCYLDGQTVERQAEVDRFQDDASIPIFFISLKAGGTGLNLTGADTVIHFDPWWNPAVEEQATSRAHRMGQSRSVQAYKLIAAGTVEEKIQALQARKRELFEASLGGDAAFVEKLTGEDLEELLAE
jgi:superfamily II DNA or RNA helicase